MLEHLWHIAILRLLRLRRSLLDEHRHQRAFEHQQTNGRELLMDLAEAERTGQQRIIAETPDFLVLCPFASRAPWHGRLVHSVAHRASISDASDQCLSELALTLKQTIQALEFSLGGTFSFNLILPHPRLDQPPQYRWMLELLPHRTTCRLGIPEQRGDRHRRAGVCSRDAA